jgi:predicted cobalt transporter CbtA
LALLNLRTVTPSIGASCGLRNSVFVGMAAFAAFSLVPNSTDSVPPVPGKFSLPTAIRYLLG